MPAEELAEERLLVPELRRAAVSGGEGLPSEHCLSVDVEDYYTGRPSRFYPTGFTRPEELERNTMELLSLLSKFETRATFFCVAESMLQVPFLVRAIQREGHEIGVHGWRHKPITRLNGRQFRDETRAAKLAIEQIAGAAIFGYRAPHWSLRPENKSAIDTLRELGFVYDSSILPRALGREFRGRIAFAWENGLVEIPPAESRVGPFRLPHMGGGYLRHLPFWWTHRALRTACRSHRSAVLMIHPYELERSFPVMPKEKRISARLLWEHLLTFHNRGNREISKLERLFRAYRFTPLNRIAELAMPPASCPTRPSEI